MTAATRKRVLLSAESSLLNSGYGVMTEAIARRLHESGRFEVAELAAYAQAGDPRLNQVPWRVYPVMPGPDDKEGRAAYDADPFNQFGKMAFHPALLHFRPHVVFAHRDTWYEQHVAYSPLRPFYRFLYVPPVDAEPQKSDWLDVMARADAVGTYTDWAASLLREQAPSLNQVGTIPPGVDHRSFQPLPDRLRVRAEFGIPQDSLVVGFVSRNQMRKRFPEFLEAFAAFLAGAPEDIASRSVLYWHTGWPDLGWDIPTLLKQSGISSRVHFTYVCRNDQCRHVFASRWADVVSHCPRCSYPACLPRTDVGLTRQDMARLYNLFDVYVQYASSEGFGVGLVEAASCGVPVMAVDYSGMEDVVRKLEGTPIAVKAFFAEAETGCRRAIPDAEDFGRKLTALLRMPEAMRRHLGSRARSGAVHHYDWDRSVGLLMEAIDQLPPALPWGSPPRTRPAPTNPPDGLSNAEFVRWGFHAVAGRPDLADSATAEKCLRDMNWGASLTGMPTYYGDGSVFGRVRGLHKVGREELLALWQAMRAEFEYWEKARCGG
jgi:glycosyltransferase involved in cell wall biosynthesis